MDPFIFILLDDRMLPSLSVPLRWYSYNQTSIVTYFLQNVNTLFTLYYNFAIK
jgi:hypothetical protein